MAKKYDMKQLKKLLAEFESATNEMNQNFQERCNTVLPETHMLPSIVAAVSSGSQERLEEALEQYRAAVKKERSVLVRQRAALERQDAAKRAFLAAIGIA
jgi:hypothetical protein